MKKIKLLLAAVAAMVTMGVQAQSWTPQIGVVYLKNLGAGLYWGAGNNWGTQASLVAEQQYATLESFNTGTYKMKSMVSNGGTDYYFNGSFMDNANPVELTFTEVSTGIYTISSGGTYYGWNGSSTVIATSTDANSDNYKWACYTQAEIDALNVAAVAAATVDAPLDATFFIKDADFGRNRIDASVWNKSGDNITLGGPNASRSYYCAESYHSAFSISQTLSNTPKGVYKLTAYGFYRQDGSDNEHLPYIYLSNGTTTLQSFIPLRTGSENDMGAAADAFANGSYALTPIYVAIGENESLTVGAKLEDNLNLWVIWDKFQLTYYGDCTIADVFGKELSELITEAQALVAAAPIASLTTDLSSAITTAQGVMSTGTTEEDFNTGKSDLQSAVNAYNAQLTLIADYLTVRAAVIANRDDNTIYTDANSALTTLNSALNTQDAAAANAANAADVTACVTALRSAFSTFMGSVTVNDGKSFDITNVFITNPAPWASTDGWNCPVAATPNSSARAAEFWNKSGVSITQEMASLPAGYYTLKAQAFARTGCSPIYIFAGAADTDSSDDNIQELIKKSNSEISTMAGAGTWFDGGNGWNTFTYQNETAGSFTIGLKDEFKPNGSHGDNNDGWLIWREFGLLYLGTEPVSVLADLYADAKAAAEAARDNATYANVAGAERSALLAAIADTPEATAESYKAKTSALIVATNSFIDDGVVLAWNNYAASFSNEVTKAIALGLTSEQANSYAATSSTTASGTTACIQNLKVAEYNFVTTNYSHAVTLGTWNASEGTGTMTSQHWDGTGQGGSEYLEQSSANYGNSSWDISYDQDITLPAGNYVFKVAGRTANTNNVTMALTVKNGETVLGTVNDFPKGDVGLGINTSGETDYTTGEGHTYANNGNGRGWEWRYVKFTLAEPATVNVAVTASATAKSQWVGFCNATVQTDDADNVAIMEALVALNDAKAAATLTERTNKGTGVFQYNKTTDDDLWSAYTTAKSNAESFTLAADTEVEDVTALTTALTNAQTNYSNNAVINAPDASKRYNVSIVDGGQAWDGNAITFVAGGRTDMGNFAVQYLASANAYMCQALKFTAVEGEDNTYKISAIRADGGEQYLTTGSTYGGYNTQIRTTDDASKASWVKIQPAATSGQFQLLNVSDGNKVIGRNATNPDNGMYTDGNNSFTIAEASQASVTVSCKAGKYGTVIFPFTPDVSTGFDGITFYSCETVNGATEKVQITEVNTPVANVPYLIKNDGGDNFSQALTGWGVATADSYTEGLLTGVFTAATIPAGANNFVLQTQGDVQAFYKVDTDFTATAYKCYLTYNSGAGAGVKALGFEFRTPTSVRGLEMAEGQNGTIFNLAGQRVQKAQKGLYIVNGKKVLVK